MSNPDFRSPRDLLAENPLLAGAATAVGVRTNHVSYFKDVVMRAGFAPRALAPSEFMKVPALLANGQ